MSNDTHTKSNVSEQWWREAVIYQIYPRSFYDSTGNGVGDLNGIKTHLRQIKSLGVDVIWVSPFFKSPMKDYGYDVEDHCDVDPSFGNLTIAQALIKEAHQLGLRLIVDLVISHTSDQHPWFKESRSSKDNPKHDYYVWADPKEDGTAPNNWLSIFGGCAWQWDTRRSQYYLHNFLTSQPDLNFHNPMIQEEVLNIAEFWLDLGVDGFRMDTVNFYFHDRKFRSNPPAQSHDQISAHQSNPYGWQEHIYDKNQPEIYDFLENLRVLLNRHNAIGLGEIGDSPVRSLDLLVEYTSPKRLHLCYSFDLLAALGGAPYWREIIERFESKRILKNPESWPCWAFSNHDVARTASRLCPPNGNQKANAELLLAMLLSMRGTPCIYQGEELGLPEVDIPFEDLVDPFGIEFWPEYKGRDGCRTPYPWTPQADGGFSAKTAKPWLPLGEEHLPLSFESQDHDPVSTLALTRQLLKIRSNSVALKLGSIEIMDSDTELLVFKRAYNEKNYSENILCIFNASLDSLDWTVPTELKLEQVLLSSYIQPEHSQSLISLPPQTWGYYQLG